MIGYLIKQNQLYSSNWHVSFLSLFSGRHRMSVGYAIREVTRRFSTDFELQEVRTFYNLILYFNVPYYERIHISYSICWHIVLVRKWNVYQIILRATTWNMEYLMFVKNVCACVCVCVRVCVFNAYSWGSYRRCRTQHLTCLWTRR